MEKREFMILLSFLKNFSFLTLFLFPLYPVYTYINNLNFVIYDFTKTTTVTRGRIESIIETRN